MKSRVGRGGLLVGVGLTRERRAGVVFLAVVVLRVRGARAAVVFFAGVAVFLAVVLAARVAMAVLRPGVLW
jgi:hypothetical protein